MKLADRMQKAKQDLGQRNTMLIAYGAAVLVAILVLLFAYRPMSAKLQAARAELESLEDQVDYLYQQIELLKKMDLQAQALPQNQISLAIDEITEQGRKLGLKFVSITPQSQQASAHAQFSKLPINLRIESEYQKLGEFLAFLEAFPRTVVKVDSLTVLPGKELRAQLETQFLLNIYLEAENAR